MKNDPLRLFASERAIANSQSDPMANLCVLATVNSSKTPEVRTLVIREVESRIGIFMNATSPKFREIRESTSVSVLAYFPSIAIQYRMHTKLLPMPTETVHAFWMNRPETAKKLDWLYSDYPQSTEVDGRDALIRQLSASTTPTKAPQSAVGFFLEPLLSVERLALNQPDGLHDRRKYTYHENVWKVSQLVP